jgi:hypothetical protein
MPGSILDDIQTMIDFIGVKGLATGSKQGNLPAAVLPQLNGLLSQPVELNLKRGLLKDYPNIGGLYALLRVMNLARSEDEQIRIHPGTLQAWSGLNPTEKYFALMEAWLIHADATLAGVGQPDRRAQFGSNLDFLANEASNEWQSYHECIHISPWDGLSTWNTQLQIRFGLFEATPRPFQGRSYPTGGWMLGAGHRTAWGEAVAWSIFKHMLAKAKTEGQHTSKFLRCELPPEADYGYFQPVFQPFFPEWRKTYALAECPGRSGLHVYRVGFDPRYGQGGVWRWLAIPHDASLHELANAILAAFDFDNDHLYEFRYRDQSGKTREYHHPGMDEGPFADEINLGESGLLEKQTMQFHYDFGDDWRFVVKLERIDPPDPKVDDFTLLESKGEAPKQYPTQEEW